MMVTDCGFNSKFFRDNRNRLRRLLRQDVTIVVTANGLLQRGADASYPFAQDANFRYLTGINYPDVTLVINGQDEFLIVPQRESVRAAFDGQIDDREIRDISGIEEIVDETNGWKRLDGLLASDNRLATLLPAPSFIEQFGMYANPARARLMRRIKQHGSPPEIFDLRPLLARMRMIKQEPELQAIQAAIDITSQTLQEILNRSTGYKFEYQIEADISHGFRVRGAEGHAFDPIVAAGIRACVLHNTANNGPIKTGEMVVLDIGASACGYAADLTRVLATAKPTPRQMDIYQAVLETQTYAINLLRPGVLLEEYEHQVVKYLGGRLRQLKLVTSLNQDGIRQFYPHATSHFLGLNVHDVGDYRKPLQPGMVLTVEPGIYIPEEGIGVRIEDDILITNSRAQILSAGLTSQLNFNKD